MTRHMLFVGFGLSDDNFHQIAYDVRSAIGPASSNAKARFGTAMLVRDVPAFDRLWQDDIRGLRLEAPGQGSSAAGGRRLEVFLDLLLAEAARPTVHLMDDDFDDLLGEDERALRDGLRQLAEKAPDAPSPAWEVFYDTLASLGWTRPSADTESESEPETRPHR